MSYVDYPIDPAQFKKESEGRELIQKLKASLAQPRMHKQEVLRHLTEVQEDLVNNPKHYQGRKCLDGLKDFLEPTEYIGGLKFNVYKYLFRYKNKNGIQDLKKAQFYLNELVDFESKQQQSICKHVESN